MTITRFLNILIFALLTAGCGSWVRVPYSPDPASVNEPVRRVEALLALSTYPAAQVEVTPDYIRFVSVSGDRAYAGTLSFLETTDFRIIRRGEIHQVSAYDRDGDEVWAYRPRSEDLETCQKMVDALYALVELGK